MGIGVDLIWVVFVRVCIPYRTNELLSLRPTVKKGGGTGIATQQPAGRRHGRFNRHSGGGFFDEDVMIDADPAAVWRGLGGVRGEDLSGLSGCWSGCRDLSDVKCIYRSLKITP